ncbi:hypothetical protein BZZ01_00105 [Nostocales cyanobacterium HT-58-2]|nr:hypothetical protein BZZ01_00105 [Nostocales cyanobacterium HT-58-2]
MSTKSLPKVSSASIKRLGQLNWLEIIGLVGLGFVVALVQANLRLPLRLPGWRGLIWLTPLVTTRLLTSSFGAASVTGLSAAGFSFLLGVRNNPFDWFFYLVVGELLDLAYHFGRKWRQKVWFWTVAAGLTHLTKPVVMIVFSAFGFRVSGSLILKSPVYPLLTHLLFGALAGFLGSLTVLCVKRIRRAS